MKADLLKNDLLVDQEKKALRLLLSNRRAQLTEGRRASAQKNLLKLLPLLHSYSAILSFSSFGTEIDTSELNHFLSQEGKLLLPKMEKGQLQLFLVADLEADLIALPSGLKEPNSKRCKAFSLQEVSLALVPALGFDSGHFRLGYGRGYYDRLLQGVCHFPTYGIGFEEQLVDQIPHNQKDVRLTSLFLS